ncbi:hypothetical protein QGN23_04310 [Chryseobacterium gotjawalense]|uniref:Uncharacterized protein n=1 Tax=Chryseobacterium gotjawalense TaxID=3042315 RepID=A0ABY8RHG4_9FLAO|nr:hypothetical protein [Chryseobacterium sp. wdc7]WHF52507.1 hypothetical protein QGN23_04310 [Chryseobacterium sp. wdc7]
MTNYWIKNETRQEIITKTLIPNKGNFELFASYFNLMDAKGLSFQFKENTELQAEKLFIKNGFEYFVLQHENFNELLILPNKNLEILTEKIVSQINFCNQESDVVHLVLDEMN